MQASQLENAYRFCEHIVRSHYENFPVASWLLPKHLRRPIAVIYAFARTADDLADEGDTSDAQRLRLLENYGEQLQHMNQSSDPIFIALTDVMQNYHLPIQLFNDLLTAFKMDVTKKRYNSFEELLEYCRHSANPIGRLLVHLNNQVTEKNLHDADQICTALQLINFYQDLHQDYHENNRIYIPQDELISHAITEKHFSTCISDEAMQKLMKSQISRARNMLLSGRDLSKILTGRMGLELKMVISGGLLICDKLLNTENIFTRPRLNRIDWLKVGVYALSGKIFRL